jgi:N-acetylmuramoyl-L-alanine amidase
MAESTAHARRAARALVVVVTASAVLGLVPVSPSSAAPETVLRSIPVDVRALLPRADRAAALTSNGELSVASAVRTAGVRECAPIWFDGLAFTWDQSGSRAVTIVAATGINEFSLGRSIRVDEEGGPDPGTAEHGSAHRGSNYVWTADARCIRFSMHLPRGAVVGNVRVLFINSSGTAGGPGTGPREFGPVAVGGPGGPFAPSAAEALTRRPRIITRAQWGADPSLMNCTPLVADFLDMGFVHHTAGSNSYTKAQADDVVRGIYAYHTNGRGWCDIGYNFLVDRFGDVFEGRSGGVTNDVIGAAQAGFNTGAFSVSVMGNFDQVRPPAPAVRALDRLLAWRLDVGHVNPSAHTVMISGGGRTTRYPAGTKVKLRTISGHRDTGLTACPGRVLYAMLPAIRSDVARIGLPKLYNPRLSTSTVVTGQPEDIRIRARGSTSMTWSVSVLDPSGNEIASFPAQTGQALEVVWPATGPPAQPDVPGVYRVVIGASAPNGALARPATLTLTVGPIPTPSPSPTASPTATTSPSLVSPP